MNVCVFTTLRTKAIVLSFYCSFSYVLTWVDGWLNCGMCGCMHLIEELAFKAGYCHKKVKNQVLW